jgi:flagellar basal body-associated protein FliL
MTSSSDADQKKKRDALIRNIIIAVVLLLLLAVGIYVFMRMRKGGNATAIPGAIPQYRFQFFG